ncbi:hypothetical protein B9T31_04990 [Acinetobacter sp. ANC 4558]|uniref:YagK/YfjJ domain-containing protein n=1 Tax=Acinetobacter sp. ANC 4558 TaxID=1977876 RepID=UPI000A3417BA|nr:inovirus-type Gp2 protein [Acinetobacter sp. ANC 4558]OTG86974.1 hypothetical protein B9T31_04990 [Acinetobacter sp. ANC 4558]
MLNHKQYRSIDQFVRNLATGSKSQQLNPTDLLPEFMLDSRYKYSEAIEIYAEVMQLLKSKKEYVSQHGMKEYVFEYIQSQAKRITDQDAGYRRCEIKNQNKLRDYLTNLLNHYARLLFVRVDFAIKKQYQHEVDIEKFQGYLQVMSNRYSNQDGYFSGLQGYAWAIEEGMDKGLHCHTLLIFDGNKHQHDFGLGLQIGQYWTQLTQDKGCCFISNDPEYKKKFIQSDTLGIGMIHRDNPKEVHNALSAAQYLVNPEKELQHLRVRLPRMRTFGTGQYVTKNRRGIDQKKNEYLHGFSAQSYL